MSGPHHIWRPVRKSSKSGLARFCSKLQARRAHAEFLAKQAAAKPAKEKAREECEAKEKARLREARRIQAQNWRKANPERAREIRLRFEEKRKAARAERRIEQIGGRPDLLPGGSL
jgi:hypothetical protein